MAITIYGIKNCDTIKKARKWLQEHDHEVELIDIVAQPPTVAQLRRAAKLGGLPVRKLFNTSGQSYRQGNFKARLPEMSEAEALAALTGFSVSTQTARWSAALQSLKFSPAAFRSLTRRRAASHPAIKSLITVRSKN